MEEVQEVFETNFLLGRSRLQIDLRKLSQRGNQNIQSYFDINSTKQRSELPKKANRPYIHECALLPRWIYGNKDRQNIFETLPASNKWITINPDRNLLIFSKTWNCPETPIIKLLFHTNPRRAPQLNRWWAFIQDLEPEMSHEAEESLKPSRIVPISPFFHRSRAAHLNQTDDGPLSRIWNRKCHTKPRSLWNSPESFQFHRFFIEVAPRISTEEIMGLHSRSGIGNLTWCRRVAETLPNRSDFVFFTSKPRRAPPSNTLISFDFNPHSTVNPLVGSERSNLLENADRKTKLWGSKSIDH